MYNGVSNYPPCSISPISPPVCESLVPHYKLQHVRTATGRANHSRWRLKTFFLPYSFVICDALDVNNTLRGESWAFHSFQHFSARASCCSVAHCRVGQLCVVHHCVPEMLFGLDSFVPVQYLFRSASCRELSKGKGQYRPSV